MAFEVKIKVVDDRTTRMLTIATFDGTGTVPNYSYGQAIAFAKQIDEGFEVLVIDTDNEDNRDKAFGLVYSRTAAR